MRFMGRELLAAGHSVKIFCLQTSPDRPLRMEHEGIEIRRFPYKPKRWPHRQPYEIIKTVKNSAPAFFGEFKPDAIWSYSPSVGLGMVRAGYTGSLLYIMPVTARLDADSLMLRTSGMPWRRRLLLLGLWPLHFFAAASVERRFLQKAQPVCHSENMHRAVLRSYGRRMYDKTVKISPGVDTAFFSRENGEKLFPEIEKQYGICAEENFVLFIGRFSAMKNLYGLLDAFSRMRCNSRLVLVGSGQEDRRLRNYVEARGLGRKVVFAGRQDDRLLPGFYSMARVFVNPSLIEPFGLTLLEAQACGVPVVGYGGNPRKFLTATEELVVDGKTGALVREAGALALARKMEAILSLDDEKHAAMSRQARENVLERFSWKRCVREAIELSLAGGLPDGSAMENKHSDN